MELAACSFVLTLVAAGLLFLATYIGGLTVAALFRPACVPPAAARRRVAILVPAHNEQALISHLLSNLQQLDYPPHGFDTYVVADNCDDRTAPLACSLGAEVYERFDRSAEGKGF